MDKMTKTARNELESRNLTCVVCNNDGVVFASDKRGIGPIMQFIETCSSPGPFYMADKVIGKAAALLCVKAGVVSVHANVMSMPASYIFRLNDIRFSFDSLVPHISNRDNTGLCPMEKLSEGVDSPDEMYRIIKDWMSSLQSS